MPLSQWAVSLIKKRVITIMLQGWPPSPGCPDQATHPAPTAALAPRNAAPCLGPSATETGARSRTPTFTAIGFESRWVHNNYICSRAGRRHRAAPARPLTPHRALPWRQGMLPPALVPAPPKPGSGHAHPLGLYSIGLGIPVRNNSKFAPVAAVTGPPRPGRSPPTQD